jgi:hypothetical protein
VKSGLCFSLYTSQCIITQKGIVGKILEVFAVRFNGTVDANFEAALREVNLFSSMLADDYIERDETVGIISLDVAAKGIESLVGIECFTDLEELLPDMDSDPNTITFGTDRFSTYTVIYGSKGSFDAYKTVAASSSKTGDSYSYVLPVAVLLIVSSCGVIMIASRKRRQSS